MYFKTKFFIVGLWLKYSVLIIYHNARGKKTSGLDSLAMLVNTGWVRVASANIVQFRKAAKHETKNGPFQKLLELGSSTFSSGDGSQKIY